MATSQNVNANPPSAESNAAQDETLLAANKAYGPNVQHIVFGIHGTNNKPEHVRPLTEKVGSTLSNTTTGPTFIDTSFNWASEAGTMNQPGGREKVGDRFAKHLDETLTELKRTGQLDPTKPIQLTVLGFSHGGNVAIGATPEIAEVLQKHGLRTNASLHLVTVSTPCYNDGGPEDPGRARQGAADRGFTNVHHTHFATKGDGVIRGAWGEAYFDGPGHPKSDRRGEHVHNYTLQGRGFLDPIGNHGAAQDDAIKNLNGQSDRVADIVRARTQDIHNRQGRPRLADGRDDDGIVVAAIPAQAERDPLVQQIRGAIDARTAKGEPLNVGASEIAALAASARREGFDKVGDVVRGKDGQLFAVDHPQADHPAARFVRADASVAALPPSAAWQKLGEVQAPTAPTLAQTPAEVETQQRGPRVA